jgi:hypothetical protein
MRSRFQKPAGDFAAITRRAGRAKRLAPMLALGVIALFSALAPAQAQLVYPHPSPSGSFPLAQAYFILSAPDPDGLLPVENGVLAFQSLPSPNADRIDIDAFATFNAAVEHTPVVISSSLTIEPPSTRPTTETDAGIHTSWALLMNPPGTMYVLDVVVECTLNGTTTKQRHIDRWTWKVVATLESLRAVIKAFASHPSEIVFSRPPVTVPSLGLIASRQTYLDLLAAVDGIQTAPNNNVARSRIDAMVSQIQVAVSARKIASDRTHPAGAILIEDLRYIRASLAP